MFLLVILQTIFIYDYRVFRSLMCFSIWLKMTEKLNLHNKTPWFYFHNVSPFYFIANISIKFFKNGSNLAYLRIHDSAKIFDPHCYEIYSDGAFCFIMIP